MRGIALTAAAALALMVASAALAGNEAKRPTLRILDMSPLTVRGANFKPGERVKLLVSAGKPVTRAVKAGPKGRFVARLSMRTGESAIVVQAIGMRGSRAMVDLTRPDVARTDSAKRDCDDQL